MKCSDANKFTNIANTRENRGLRPTGGQKENGFPLERATRRDMGETLEAVMLKSPRTYKKKKRELKFSVKFLKWLIWALI